jgi:glycosyltransferase involved in cell wall biosynthesis
VNGPVVGRGRPTVSVLMAAYNAEKHIRQAVDSILCQTLTDFEFVIVDDGSTDQTPFILRSYADPRIRLFSQPHSGLVASLNRCLSLAAGQYLARMDADDASCPSRLEAQHAFLESHPEIGLLGACCLQMDESGAPVKLYTYPTEDGEIRRTLRSDCPFCHSVVMFRPGCIGRVGGYRSRIGPAEDYDLWLRISEHFALANLPHTLHAYRLNSAGVSLSNRFDQVRATLLARSLAEERQCGSRDSLERLTDADLENLLDRLLPKTPANLRRVAHSTALYLAEVSYCTTDYRQAGKRWLEAARLKPLAPRNWGLAWRLLICLLTPAALTRRLKALYGRWA